MIQAEAWCDLIVSDGVNVSTKIHIRMFESALTVRWRHYGVNPP